MDGLLVVDKPAGVTSHDVVARIRRVLRERSVGHTGTLDPLATGVLPLVLGRATRLARFLSASDKSYDAVIRFGFSTDTGDADGMPIDETNRSSAPPVPSPEAIDRALGGFRGTFLQQPPAFSAKKIAGTRSYRLARAASAASPPSSLRPSCVPPASLPRPQSVPVTVHDLRLLAIEGPQITLHIRCSAGFYVRSLAHDLGTQLGLGAHLTALRRTRSGDCTLDDAMTLDQAERNPAEAAQRVIPLARMVPSLPSVTLTPDGVRRARHGRDLGPADLEQGVGFRDSGLGIQPYVRLLNLAGDLVGIAVPAAVPGLLHPSVVLM
jgi:tRNA pseudouridine55 synthase